MKLQGLVHCHGCFHRHLWASLHPIRAPYSGLADHDSGLVGDVFAKRGGQLHRLHPLGYRLSWMGPRLPADVLVRENKQAVWVSLECHGTGAMTLPAYQAMT